VATFFKNGRLNFGSNFVKIYDAMTSSRIYRKALCPFHVVRDMEQDAFTKFDIR